MAGIKEFKRVAGATEEVAALQVRLNEFFAQFINNPLLDGLLIKDVVLTASAPKLVQHKLGRELQGWIIVNQNANAVIWQSDSSKSSIELTTSADVTVSLWVF